MTMISSRLAATAFASLLLAGSAFAQTPAPATPAAPATSAAPAAKATTAKPHSAASVECSKEADAKSLHGKDRKKFRSQCKADAKKS